MRGSWPTFLCHAGKGCCVWEDKETSGHLGVNHGLINLGGLRGTQRKRRRPNGHYIHDTATEKHRVNPQDSRRLVGVKGASLMRYAPRSKPLGAPASLCQSLLIHHLPIVLPRLTWTAKAYTPELATTNTNNKMLDLLVQPALLARVGAVFSSGTFFGESQRHHRPAPLGLPLLNQIQSTFHLSASTRFDRLDVYCHHPSLA